MSAEAEAAFNPVDVIKNLIEICRDAQAGYLIAAEHARNSELRAFFSKQSLDRARFAAELVREARRMSESEISRDSGIMERINRAWNDLKPKLVAGDNGVLDTVEVAERNARAQYQMALRTGFPPNVKSIVERESDSVSAAYEQVCRLLHVGGKAA